MRKESNNVGDIIRELETDFGIRCGETLTLGNVCKTVYRASDGHRKLVVKIGEDDRSSREVLMNRTGYDVLRSIGARRLIPDPVVYLEVRGIPVLVMQDCGSDFLHAVQKASDPVVYYERLVDGMLAVYRETRRADPPVAGIRHARDKLASQYRERIPLLVPRKIVERLERSDALLDLYRGAASCFSTFDFTPEDVFLTPDGVKYADPLPESLGLPVIDLACFVGVARDVYHLPGSVEGYGLIERFACSVLPRELDLSEEDACRVFALGRALQCALSARFHGEPEQTLYAKESVRFAKIWLDPVGSE